MKQTRLLRIISFIVAFIMLLEIGPIHAFAIERPPEEETPDIPMPEIIDEAVSEIPAVYIEGEVPELRNEYEKHYRLTDGSYMAVQYQVPVHYENGGQWEDIDNTLEPVTMFSGDTVYQAVNGENVQAFASDLSDGTIMTMATDDHMISMSIWTYDSVEEAVIEDEPENSVGAEDDAVVTEPVATPEAIPAESADSAEATEVSNPDNDLAGDVALVEEEWAVMADVSLEAAENIQENATVEEQQDDTIVAQILTEEDVENPVEDTEETEPWELDDVMPDALSSSILYEDVFPGVDLRYDTFSYNVKESIILKQPMDLDEYAYSFLLTLDGLEPELQEDGSILLLDDDYEVQYTIPAPYMWDAENVYSDAVFYELEETGDGWVLTVCADENWLEDGKRAYPVTIDPSINIDTGIKYTTSVQTGTPKSNSDAARPGRMSCGYSTDFGQMVGYAQIPTLPTLPIGSTVIAAKFKPISASHWLAANCRMDIYMLKTQVADEYWNGIIPWTQQPEVEGSAMDFVVASQKTNVDISPGSWDITPAFMQWMEDSETNFGLKALGVPTKNNKNAFIRFDKDKSYITVTYRNTVGTESYYTYETQSAVRAGTGYIGDFSSSLTVIKTDVSYSSATIPFSVSHVYNSSLAGKEISAYRENEGILAPDYSKMKTGNGWQLSVQESVVQKHINGDNRQVYRDSDGTLHYFNWVSGSTYVDEDGLGLTLRQYADGGDKDRSYEIKDQQGNIRFFRNNMISYIADANDNRIYFIYNVADYNASTTDWHPKASSSNKLTKIVAVNDGKSKSDICTFGYVGDRLSTITDYANRVTSFSYDDKGNLESITHPDGTMAKYTYDNSGRMTSMCDIEAKYGIAYEYDGDGISEFFEYTIDENNNKSEGTRVRRSKPSIQEAEYRYDGNDREIYSDDDIVNRYVFDYNGRTINAVTLNSNQDRILGVTVAAYKASSTENPAANNRITKTGHSGQNGVNLLKNSGMEYENGSSTDLDWDSLTVNQSNYSGEFSDDSSRTGQNALKTTINNSVATNYNEARRTGMYQDVILKPRTTYTFSAYVNTNDVTNFSTGSVFAAFLDSDKAVLKAGNKITYKTDAEIDGGWQRVYCTYTTGNTEESLYVAVIQENAFGTVYYDDLQLEIGDVPSTVNLLQNATFDQGKTHWSGEDFTPETNGNDEFHHNVLSVDGSSTAYLKASQQIQIEQVCTDQTFLLSGWGKAASAADCKTEFSWTTSAEINSEHGKRFFGLIAKCRYTKDGSRYTDYHYMPFNDDYDDWQFASCVIVPKADYQKEGMVLNYIEVYIVYDKNFNTMLVDNLSLRQEPCTTYSYNALGNVVNVGATGSESQAVKYVDDDDPRPATVWKSKSEIYYYQYYEDNKYLPTYISNAKSLVYTEYDYDTVGNLKSTTIGKFNDEGIATSYPKLKSTAKYSTDGSQLKEETNANGQTILYEYNARRNLVKTIDENGTEVISIENTLNNRPHSSYINGTVSVGYSYDRGLLSRITRGGFITGNAVKQNQFYNMTYDDFGNMIKISIGGTDNVPLDTIVLATYDYGIQNGLLNSMTYGETDSGRASISYTYDELDRLTKETWSDGTSYQYFYNSEGALTKKVNSADLDKVDNGTADAVNYEYDSIGRLIHSSASKEGVTTMLTEHMYDRQNRISEQSYQIRNSDDTFKTYSLKYSYRGSDSSLVKVESSDGYIDAYSLTYDEIARLSTRTNSFFEQTYAYKTTGGTTTTQIESIDYDAGTYASNFEEFTLSYEYDDLGNIETINNSANPSDNRAYSYDIQGQLLSETFGTEGNSTTNSYTYDTYGNIRVAVKNGEENEYEYGNPDWKDLLTAYDDHTILYEGQSSVSDVPLSGNPVSYYNGTSWTFAWSKGRLLESASGNGKTISYTYDMAGIRNSKTVNGITYHYDTLDGKVVRQTWTENGNEHVFDIIYDASGLPYACVYDGNRYYYVLNQQGDVIRIVGYLGATLCEYQYDAWGNVIDISGPYDYSIGRVNPIRYRGYYYDAETGFYYLQSRYYDPTIGRFINADTFASTGQGFLGYNMFAYCGNRPAFAFDSTGHRTYFLNGIMNPYEDDVPNYVKRFQAAMRKYEVHDVTGIPLYKSQTQWSVGMLQVINEMLNIDEYTQSTVDWIENDLDKDPLAEGEQLNIIGYSGGGQIALNVAEKLSYQVDNVILIGAPVFEIFTSDASVLAIRGGWDPLSITGVLSCNMNTHLAGWYSHEGYFYEENIDTTARIVADFLGR